LAIYFLNVYVKQQAKKEKLKAEQVAKNMVPVIVAVKDIPPGTKLTEAMLQEVKVPKEKFQPVMANSFSKVIDRTTATAIKKGSPITANALVAQAAKKPAGAPPRVEPLSAKIPPGRRAVTIDVDNLSTAAGMIRPGDYVDLIGLVTIPGDKEKGRGQLTTLPLFQNILVLALGQEMTRAGAPKGPGGKNTVTLSLSPEEASIVTFIAEQGKIRMILRSPQDKQAGSSVPADWNTVMRALSGQEQVTTGPELNKPRRTIEIIRGSKKETKVLD
jgi:pilus assembly protein CpaB